MNFEERRLRTFTHPWPVNAPVDAARIANGGFFYTGQGLEVQCFCCGAKISEWNVGDHVMARHRRLDPRCPFIVNPATSANIPKFVQNSHSNNIPPQPQTTQMRSPLTEREIAFLRLSQTARLETYTDWPVAHVVTPQHLSQAGFYSIHQGDKVKCAFCNGVVGFWEIGDDPKSEHRRHFPYCSYVLSNFSNVTTSTNTDVATNTTSISKSITTNLQELGIQTHKGPRQSDFATVESRLRSYLNWPIELIQTPEMLSEAGFYYVGTGDHVRCFYCDGGLRHWDPEDEPWVEHARWFPTCGFLRIVKGSDFIKSCIPDNGSMETSKESRLKRSTPVPATRVVTDTEVQSYMNTEPVLAALNIGIDLGRVKNAIRYKIQLTGVGFTCADTLIEAALNLEVEDIEAGEIDNRDIESSEEVLRILSSILIQNEKGSELLSSKVEKVEQKTAKKQVDAGDSNWSLEEENRLLREARLCKICMDNEIGIVFLPCGHLTTCVNCAPSLKDCPVCRSAIKATVRTFLS